MAGGKRSHSGSDKSTPPSGDSAEDQSLFGRPVSLPEGYFDYYGIPRPKQTSRSLYARPGRSIPPGLLAHYTAQIQREAAAGSAQTKPTPEPVDAGDEEAPEGERVGATGGDGVSAQSSMHPVQARGLGPSQRQDQSEREKYIRYQVRVTRSVDKEGFERLADQQIFGGPQPNGKWINVKAAYAPGTYVVHVAVSLLKQQRGAVSKAKGLDVEPDGSIAGAEERSKKFQSAPASAEKSALMDEIDRRYYAATGSNTKIKSGEGGHRELWFQIRDEVLFQQEYIANLPPKVKQLFKESIKGRELAPADYEQLLRIAKSIAQMPAGAVSDYASKVTGATTNLDAFEAAVQKYQAELAEREKQAAARDTIKTKLSGLEDVYRKFRAYGSMLSLSAGSIAQGGPVAALPLLGMLGMMRQELQEALPRYGFASLAEFEAYIQKFEQAFVLEAANIAKDILGKYAGKLYKESARYQNPTEISALYQRLGNFRAQSAEFEKNAAISNDYAHNTHRGRFPGNGHLQPKIGPDEARAAHARAVAAKSAAQGELKGLGSAHPVFQEAGVPDDKRIDKTVLAKAGEGELGGLIQAHIKSRQRDVAEALAQIEAKPALIYTMDALMPQFYAQMGIVAGSIHDLILRDKIKDDAIVKLATGIVLLVVAIALAALSGGTATPAIAAGATAAGLGISAYQTYEEYQEYTQEKDLADVGFANEPSVVWLVVAIVGAGIDMAVAVKAIKALGPAAKALEEGGNVDDFIKGVKQLEKAGELEADVARAAAKAAAARKAFAQAGSDLVTALGSKAYAFPGPFTDPDVFRALVKLAREGFKSKFHDVEKFIAELKRMRAQAKLAEMTPEELTKVKEAWEQAKILEAAEATRYEKLVAQVGDAAKVDVLLAKLGGDTASLERLLKLLSESELQTIVNQVADARQLLPMLDQVGHETGVNLLKQWSTAGKTGQMNQFLERMAAGGKQLGETTALSGKALIIDSNTAIALVKDADPTLRATMNAVERGRVAYIKSLPADTELRVANVTVGEIQGGLLNVKGVPLEVARESADYQKVLNILASKNVGTGRGIADRCLVADAFFAKTEPGAVSRFLSADQDVIKKLADLAGINVNKAGGFEGLLKTYGSTGFSVTVEGRTLLVIPVP